MENIHYECRCTIYLWKIVNLYIYSIYIAMSCYDGYVCLPVALLPFHGWEISLANQPSNLRWKSKTTSLPILLSSRPNALDHHTWTNVRCTWALPEPLKKKWWLEWNCLPFEIADCLFFRGRCLLNFQEFYWGKMGFAEKPRKKVGKKTWRAIRSFQTGGESDFNCALRNKCCWETLGNIYNFNSKKRIDKSQIVQT